MVALVNFGVLPSCPYYALELAAFASTLAKMSGILAANVTPRLELTNLAYAETIYLMK